MSDVTAGEQAAPHCTIGGVPIFHGGPEAAVALCIDRLGRHETTRIATANLDFLALARRNPQLRSDLARSTLVVADGAPVALLARLSGAAGTKRVAGVDLVAALCAAAGQAGGLRIVLYGSTEEIAGQAATHLSMTFPGVDVVGIICPPFRELSASERDDIAGQLADAEANLVLVALGCPAQERFAAEFSGRVPGLMWLGVGGSFDFFAGRRVRAPRLAQRLGLEWLVRLVQEPRRLARRYLLRDTPEFFRLLPMAMRARFQTGPGAREAAGKFPPVEARERE